MEVFPRTPEVSLVIACRNAARHLDAALNSARRQTLREIEILVVDDKSTDDTSVLAKRHAHEDARIRLLLGPGKGPGAARNVALGVAAGAWIAILDSDDVMHPRRLQWMLEAADPQKDIIADNLIVFEDPPAPPLPHLLLEGASWAVARHIDLATYIKSNALFTLEPPLGYLKPLIRREALARQSLRYNESLRIGEDFDLVARLMAGGAKFGFVPIPLYFYRRHANSTSFRMGSTDISALLEASTTFDAALPPGADETRAACAVRRKSLQKVLHFTRSIEQIKRGDWLSVVGNILTHPQSLPLLLTTLWGSLRRRMLVRPIAIREPGRPRALVLAREGGPASRSSDDLSSRGDYANLVLPLQESDLPGTREWTESALRVAQSAESSEILYEDENLEDLAAYGLAVYAHPVQQLTDGAIEV